MVWPLRGRIFATEEKIFFKLAEFMAFLTASYCLTSAMKPMFILYLSFEIRETMNNILCFITLIPLKWLLLPSGSHIVSCFSTRAEIPFRLHEIFSDFQARLAGLKILARFERTGLGFSARAESLRLHCNLRGFVSEAGLKFQPGFQPGMKFAM